VTAAHMHSVSFGRRPSMRVAIIAGLPHDLSRRRVRELALLAARARAPLEAIAHAIGHTTARHLASRALLLRAVAARVPGWGQG
jgi:hypothetical protein